MTKIDQWMLDRLAYVMTDIKEGYDACAFSRVYKSVYAFCNEDLSNFYLDILKDRLYISPSSDPGRRSAQSVLYHVLNHLLRSMTPVLIFTVEEIFSFMPKGRELKTVGSVHLLKGLDVPQEWRNPEIVKFFERALAIRPFVSKAMDDKRREGVVGSSLDAKITIETSSVRMYEHFNAMGDILEELFAVSQVVIKKVDVLEKGLSESLPQIH
ncbi:MAG: hypothetical protein COW13_01580, partial [Candidatus Omnitrophica bacterium CG12_big_fil_rev_8_21_14_0_65_50_5]